MYASLQCFFRSIKKRQNQSSARVGTSPKNHLYVHLFDNIEQKGVTRNYSTKPNEKSHGGLKTMYCRQTNFKNIAPQILLIDYLKQVSDFIWDEIDVLNASRKLVAPTPAPEDDDAEDDDVIASPSGHYSLGSRDKPITLVDVEANHQGDAAFEQFRLHLVEFLNRELDVERRPGHRYLRNPGDQLTKATYDIALVHSLDRPSGIRQQKDIDLQLLRLRARPRKSAEFIFLSSILRGVLVVPDFDIGFYK
ncbi:hypothetical protein EYR36_001211 [Pleurotus pulmonarius]|nr:hypothetical protein EYR36_001211 [Pleurotus pulmonarius]